ncbi:hypothetical protein P0Y35_04855 [Kiritimatiellaeota bacterium B1221]|nr:hypothetical protein [Kiritimatiellaeota bacterium B1221]
MTKITLLTIGLLNIVFLSACGGDTSKNSSASSPDIKKVTASIREYMDSERALRTFISKNGLDQDPEIMAADKKAFEATQQFTKIRKNHPELKEMYAENDRLQGEAIDAKLADDNETYKAKMSEYTAIRSRIESAAKELPEIQTAQKELQSVLDEQNELLASKVAAVNGEGKKIAKNYRDLHEQFKGQR